MHFHSALARDLFDRRELLQPVERGENHVVRIRRAEILRENVLNSGAFHDGAYGTAGDHPCSGCSRLHQNFSRTMAPHDFVRNRSARHRDARHVAARAVDCLAHCLGNFVSLSRRETYLALTVAHGDEGIEREPPAALHDFGDAIDRDNVFDQLASAVAAATVASSAVTSLAVARAPCSAFAPTAATGSAPTSSRSAASPTGTAASTTPAAAAASRPAGSAAAARAAPARRPSRTLFSRRPLFARRGPLVGACRCHAFRILVLCHFL